MKIHFLIGLFLIFVSTSFCQLTFLEIGYDARSMAMGEAFVANTNGSLLPENNPATLSGQKGLSVFYSKRNLDWSTFTKNYNLFSFGTNVSTSIGNFAVHYKMYDEGEQTVSYIDEPYLYEGVVKPNYFVASVSYANKLNKNINIGISIKTIGYKNNVQKGSYKDDKSNMPLLADIGFIYSAPGFVNKNDVKDNLILGLSLNNFGTDFKITYNNVPGGKIESVVKIPRYLRLGFAYEIIIPNASDYNLFQLVLTGEYDRLLNSYNPDSEKDYWGTGIETTFLDLISLRLGGIAYPYKGIVSEKGVLTIRYGLGINLPFKRAGIDLPFSITFDYAVMPINNIGSHIVNNNKKNLDAFNISINYCNTLF